MDIQFSAPLVTGTLVRRYKRFFAEVVLDSGEQTLAHCANTGKMEGMTTPGTRVALRPQREGCKLPYIWEMAQTEATGDVWIGVNTQNPNRLVKHGILTGRFPWAREFRLRCEVPIPGGRLDFLLYTETTRNYIEVKNVHWKQGETARFPDCVTERGTRHLNSLHSLATGGETCYLIYILQRSDCYTLGASMERDPVYAKAFRDLLPHITCLGYAYHLTLEGIAFSHALEIVP